MESFLYVGKYNELLERNKNLRPEELIFPSYIVFTSHEFDLDTTLKVSTLYFSLVVAPRTILAGLLSIVTALPYAK